MKEMPEELLEVVQLLRSDLIELQVRWKIYDQLYILEKDIVEILTWIAPGFFGLTQVIYRDAIVLGIARMTDVPGSKPKAGKKDKRNLSVGHALNLLNEKTHKTLKWF